MSRLSYRIWAPCLLGLVLGVGCAGNSGGRAKLSTGEAFFVENVKPMLERQCLRCHDGSAQHGSRMNLTDAASALSGKKGGKPYIVPGNAAGSRIVAAVSRKGTHPLVMPQLPVSLTDDQIGTLREWIDDGAAWPSGEAGHLKPVKNPENP